MYEVSIHKGQGCINMCVCVTARISADEGICKMILTFRVNHLRRAVPARTSTQPHTENWKVSTFKRILLIRYLTQFLYPFHEYFHGMRSIKSKLLRIYFLKKSQENFFVHYKQMSRKHVRFNYLKSNQKTYYDL